MSLKLVTEKAFEKWCKGCKALTGSEHGGPSVAIICDNKRCIYKTVRQRRLAGMVYDEDEIAAIIGSERIEALKAKAKRDG